MAGHGPQLLAVNRLLIPSTPAAPSGKANAVAAVKHATTGRGFRHLLEGSPHFRPFNYDGEPVNLDNPAQLRALRGTMSKLAAALEKPPTAAQAKFFENPTDTADELNNAAVPSGYTYLLQLVAHDLVQSAVSLALVGDGCLAVHNNRTTFLALETLYGGGPTDSPLVYTRASPPVAADGGQTPSYLRLGPIKEGRHVCPFRDLARINVADQLARTNVAQSPAEGQSSELPDVLIADARNDDHAILSQLTTVFHLFHNGIVALLERAAPAGAGGGDPAFERYTTARCVTTLAYREIVRRELLPLILHPVVWEAYKNAGAPLLEAFDGRIPLEFSYGAFRLGHAMLRPVYQLNENESSKFSLQAILRQTSGRSPGQMPFTLPWAVAWSHFFTMGEVKPNLSRRIQPFYSTQLLSDDTFPAFDETGRIGLAYRDMLSAAFAGLWSVPALVERLRDMPRLGQFFQESWLADREKREAALGAWLNEAMLPGEPLLPADTAALVGDPPLPFFLLFEAWHDPDSQGRCFGPMASVIVAEVIIGALAHERIVADEGLVDLNEIVTRLVGERIPPDMRNSIAGIRTMADMIKVTARMHRLDEDSTIPAFL